MAGTRRGSPREGGLEAGTVYEEGFYLRQALSASIAALELQLGVVLRAAEEPSARAGSRGGIVRLRLVTKSVILVTVFQGGHGCGSACLAKI